MFCRLVRGRARIRFADDVADAALVEALKVVFALRDFQVRADRALMRERRGSWC